MPLTSAFTRIAFAPADPPGGGDVPGGPRAQRPLVPGIPSRRVDPNGVVTQQTRHLRPNQQQPARQTVADAGELVVGQGITVKGGIRDCRRLVVHGTVQATVPAQALEVGPDGVVEGRVDVGEATIAGRFDGDLVVDGALTVAPGGVIRGRVRYRTLTVESGGHVSAEIDHIEASPLPTRETAADAPAAAPAAEAPETPEPFEPAQPDAGAHEAGAHEAGASEAADATQPTDGAAPQGPQGETPGVPPAFNGLAGLNGSAGNAWTEPQADPAAAEGSADEAEDDAERFYRSLARTSARA